MIGELVKVGYIAVGMEQFPATDEDQMDYIRPIIDESDYYVVIVKGRFGSLASNERSFTENEFRYAKEKGKPCLAFIFEDWPKLSLSDTDDDPAKMVLLKAFIEEYCSILESRFRFGCIRERVSQR